MTDYPTNGSAETRPMVAQDDIVARLRARALIAFQNGADGNAFIDEHAADEIERLRAEVARLGSFIHPIGTVMNGKAVRGE